MPNKNDDTNQTPPWFTAGVAESISHLTRLQQLIEQQAEGLNRYIEGLNEQLNSINGDNDIINPQPSGSLLPSSIRHTK
jgi:hypothetical protein